MHAQTDNALNTNETAGPVWQEVTSIISILQNLEQLKSYKQVKRNIEQFVSTLGTNPITPAQLIAFKQAYDQTKVAFDGFILEVKQDLMSKSRIQELKRHPATFANKYLTLFNGAVTTYNTQMQGLITNYQTQYQSANRDKGWLKILQLLFPVANEIVNALSQRRSFDWTKLPIVLNSVNSIFVRDYEMKSWEKLVPANLASTTSGSTNTLVTPAAAIIESVPTFTDMTAGFSFYKMVTLPTGKPARMLLKLTNVASNVFSTNSTLKTGDQFQIKVAGNAYIYSFSLNSNNKVQLIYPYNKMRVQSRDIGIDTLVYNPLAARTESSFMIPKKDASGRDMFITLRPNADGSMTDDNICIIYSTKEITDLDAFISRVETATGNISARLSAVLTTTGANIESAPQITYNQATKQYTFGTNKEIIPIVIKIKKTPQ